MNDVLDVSRYIINYSNERGYGISNLKLQKVLYLVQASFLVYTDAHQPCFPNDFEAWQFGPVIPEVYHEYKCYGSSNIPTIKYYYRQGDKDFGDLWKMERVEFNSQVIPECDRREIEEIVDMCASYSATDLVRITHNQAPWRDAYTMGKRKIEKDAIKGYFM